MCPFIKLVVEINSTNFALENYWPVFACQLEASALKDDFLLVVSTFSVYMCQQWRMMLVSTAKDGLILLQLCQQWKMWFNPDFINTEIILEAVEDI